MADEMFDLLDKEEVQRSRTFLAGSPHSFLDRVITPIHKILAAVRSADHLHLVALEESFLTVDSPFMLFLLQNEMQTEHGLPPTPWFTHALSIYQT